MPEQGSNIGNAYATISLVLKGVRQARQQLEQEARAAGQAVDGIGEKSKNSEQKTTGAFGRMGAGVDQARAAIKQFNESPLGKIQKGLDDIKKKITGVSLAAAGITAFGIKSAQDVNKLNTSIELFVGNADKAKAIMDDTRKMAKDFGSPYLDLLSGARAFLPLAKANNTDLNTLLKTAIRFQAYNPQKSFDEIKFSINEALSGDFQSIKDALDLEKPQREALKKAFEENGPDAVLKNINDILVQRGFNDEFLKKYADSGANAFAELQSSVKELIATAFMPLLKDVVLPLVRNLKDFFDDLRTNHPELLKIGAGFTLAVAAALPLLTAVTSIIGAFKALKIVSAALKLGDTFKGAAGAVGKVAGVGLAAGAGAFVGLEAAKGLANAGVRTGDLGRIAAGEDAGAILSERIKQIIVILAQGVIELAKLLTKAGAFIFNAADQILNAFKLVGTYLREFGGTLQKTIGDLLVGFSQLLAKIPGAEGLAMGVLQAGGGLQATGIIEQGLAKNDRAALQKRLGEGFTVPQSTLDEIDARFADVSRTIVGGLTDFLFPVEKKAEEVVQSIEAAGNTIANAPVGDSEEYLAQQMSDVADAVKSYNDDLAKLETDKQQSIIDINTKYADETIRIAQERAQAEEKALTDLIRDREKMNRDYQNDLAKEERTNAAKRQDKLIDLQRKERDAAVDNASKLVEIRRQAGEKERDALLNQDFAALFKISEDTKSQIDEAQSGFDQQRAARTQALQDESDDMTREFERQRQERAIQFDQQLSERSIAYHNELTDLQTQSAEKLSQAQTAHAQELQQIQQKYQQELTLRQQAIQQELQILMMGEQQKNQFLLSEQQKYMQQAIQLANQLKLPTQQTTRFTQQQVQPIVQRASQTVQSVAQSVQSSPVGQFLTNFFGGVTNRAAGGTLDMGQSSFVNEPWSSQAERWLAGGRSYDLGGTGILTPLTNGRVDPGQRGSSGRRTVVVPVTITAPIDSGILTVEQALALIQDGAQQAVLNMLEAYDRG